MEAIERKSIKGFKKTTALKYEPGETLGLLW